MDPFNRVLLGVMLLEIITDPMKSNKLYTLTEEIPLGWTRPYQDFNRGHHACVGDSGGSFYDQH